MLLYTTRHRSQTSTLNRGRRWHGVGGLGGEGEVEHGEGYAVRGGGRNGGRFRQDIAPAQGHTLLQDARSMPSPISSPSATHTATGPPPRPRLLTRGNTSSKSLGNLFKDPRPSSDRRGSNPSVSESELKKLRESIDTLLPLINMEQRIEKRMDTIENVIALRLTRIENALVGLKQVATNKRPKARHGSLDDMPSCFTHGPTERGASPPTVGLGEESVNHSRASFSSREQSMRDVDNLLDEMGSISSNGHDSTYDPTRPFVRIRALVDSDIQIRSQLHDLRSSLRYRHHPNQYGDGASRSATRRLPALPMLVRQLSSINRKRSNSGSTPNDGAVSVGDDEGAPDTALATPRDGRCLKLLRALSCGFPVLHPDGRFRSFWNTIMAILICFCGVAIPLDIAFETDMIRSMCPIDGQLYPFCPKWQVWKWVNYVVDFCFMCDIIINCRTVRAGRARRPCAPTPRTLTLARRNAHMHSGRDSAVTRALSGGIRRRALTPPRPPSADRGTSRRATLWTRI